MIESIMWAIVAVILISFFIVSEALDWGGRVEYVRTHYPRLYEFANWIAQNRLLRVVLLLIAIGMLARASFVWQTTKQADAPKPTPAPSIAPPPAPAPRAVIPKPAPPKSEAPPARPPAPSADVNMHIACKMLTSPPLVSPGGEIWVAQLFPSRVNIGGLGRSFLLPDAPAPKPLWRNQPGHQCDITNYGTRPVFNVSLDLWTEFRTAIRKVESDPRSEEISQGSVVASGKWPLTYQQIGPNVLVTFYLLNTSPDHVVTLSLPRVATVQLKADGPNETIPLARSAPETFTIFPEFKTLSPTSEKEQPVKK